jgi:LPXTG-motif cell wall-anchored protein
MGIPGGTSVQSSESTAFGDQRTSTRGQATANIGLVNAVFGRGNALSASASAGASVSPWVWVGLAAVLVGGAGFLLLKKKG